MNNKVNDKVTNFNIPDTMTENINIQMKIGQNPPFLTRNNTTGNNTTGNSTAENIHPITKICRKPKETECASFTITDSRNMEMSGFINNRGTTIPITVRVSEPVITFSCFDEIHLFFYDLESVYYTRFYCCRNWEIKTLKAVKIDFNLFTEEMLIPIEIVNLRDNSGTTSNNDIVNNRTNNNDITKNSIINNNILHGYHYNVNQSIAPDKYVIQMESKDMILTKYQCPICFRITPETDQLRRHIELIHPSYEIENGDVKVVKKREDSSSSVEDRSTSILSLGIDFCDERIDEREDGIEYIDFWTGTPEEDSDSSSSEDRPALRLNKANKLNVRVKNPIELAEWKIMSKEKNVSRIEMVLEPLIKKPGKKDTTMKFKEAKASIRNRGYISGFILEQANKMSYIKNKPATPILNYKFKKYGLLMEREFDSFDYSGMVAKYINRDLEEKFESGGIEERDFEMMEKWNESIVKEGSVEKALASLLKKVRLNKKMIELIDLLYTRGLLNSEELIKIFETE